MKLINTALAGQQDGEITTEDPSFKLCPKLSDISLPNDYKLAVEELLLAPEVKQVGGMIGHGLAVNHLSIEYDKDKFMSFLDWLDLKLMGIANIQWHQNGFKACVTWEGSPNVIIEVDGQAQTTDGTNRFCTTLLEGRHTMKITDKLSGKGVDHEFNIDGFVNTATLGVKTVEAKSFIVTWNHTLYPNATIVIRSAT